MYITGIIGSSGIRRTPREIVWRMSDAGASPIREGQLAQLVRALHSHCRGHWFESSIVHKKRERRRFLNFWAISSVGRALHSHCRGRRFDSAMVHLRK